METAAFAGAHQRPKFWEKRVLAAYLRMMGSGQKEAGAAVGRSVRTIRDWEAETDLWATARAEAQSRWLVEVTDVARVAVLNAIKAGAWVPAFQVLERVEPALAPAKQRAVVEVDVRVETMTDDQLKAHLQTVMLQILGLPSGRELLAAIHGPHVLAEVST